MAAALGATSFPLPLLLDSLLASSWTWLALSLATIATLVRALTTILLPRSRPQVLLPPPSSSEAERISFFESAGSQSSGNSKKRRSKSSPALENLLQSPDGRSCPHSGSSSCMQGCIGATFPLRKAASSSNILEGHDSFTGVNVSRSFGVVNYGLGLEIPVGFLVDTQEGGYETPTHVLEEDADSPHYSTSNAFSSCKPPQNLLFDVLNPSSESPACFEKQSRWHSLLQTKLDLPWQNHLNVQPRVSTHILEPAERSEGVVKVWSNHETKLFDALMVDGLSVAALNVNIGEGLVQIAHRDGVVSQWDISNQACTGSARPDRQSISVLSWNAEKGVLVMGMEDYLDLWDCRTPRLIPVMDRRTRSVNAFPFLALHCSGNMIHGKHCTGGFSSSCDLRKPQGSCISSLDSVQVLPNGEEEKTRLLWEKLSYDDEEIWDECDSGPGKALQGRNSFTLKCATIVRSLSAAGR